MLRAGALSVRPRLGVGLETGPGGPVTRLGARLPLQIMVDGLEDQNGRALFLISALHLAAETLAPSKLRIVNPSSRSVTIGAEALAWDTGLEVEVLSESDAELRAMESAHMALTVATWEPNWPFIAAAYKAGLETIAAVQFPRLNPDLAPYFAHVVSAHDTEALADRIRAEAVALRA